MSDEKPFFTKEDFEKVYVAALALEIGHHTLEDMRRVFNDIANAKVAPLIAENERLNADRRAFADETETYRRQWLGDKAEIARLKDEFSRLFPGMTAAEIQKLTEQTRIMKAALRKAILFAECVVGKKAEEINYTYLNEAREALAKCKELGE